MKTGTKLPGAQSPSGDFEDWIAAGLDLSPEHIRVTSVYRGEALPDPRDLSAVVITGSSAMVSSRESWSERTADWIRRVVDAETPVLGICYGHQLLAHAMGGLVGPNPRGREIGTVNVTLAPDRRGSPLSILPDVVRVHTTHVESVLELPAGAMRLASNENDPNHAMAIGETAWGVQWHPEFDAEVMRGYLEGRRDILESEGLDPDALILDTTVSPHGRSLLQRFGEIATLRMNKRPING